MNPQQNTIFGNKETKKLSNKLIPGLKKGKVQKEEKVQIQICKYLHLAYPRVIFTCDLSSGMKLPIHIAAKNKQMRSSRGLPDLFIASVYGDAEEALYRTEKPFYSGLFIELKSEGTVIWNKDGSFRKDPHLNEQKAILDHLETEGYKAVFACGFDEAKKIIDDYLKK